MPAMDGGAHDWPYLGTIVRESEWVDVNDFVAAATEARISVFDRSVTYGDAIYTTLRVCGGEPLLLGRHLARLQRDADRLMFGIEVAHLSLETRIKRLLVINSVLEGYARVEITRGTRLDLVTLKAFDPSSIITTSNATFSSSPIAARTCSDPRDAFRDAKITSRVAAMFSLRSALFSGADEAIFVSDSEIIEGTCHNIFELRSGALVTPDVADRGLAGVIRQVLLEEANAKVASVSQTTEGPLYATNCLVGVVEVTELNGDPLRRDPVCLSSMRKILSLHGYPTN